MFTSVDLPDPAAAQATGPSRGTRLGWVALVVVLGVGVDQWSKQLARDRLAEREWTYLAGSVRLVHAENSGAFLSLGDALSPRARFAVFVGANTVLLVFVLGYALAGPLATTGELACYALILAGGAGNMIDRVAKGTVTDFVQLRAGPVGTGIFNVADVAIMGGVIAILVVGRSAGAVASGAGRGNLNSEASP